MDEYTGQCFSGPEDGNLVTSSSERFTCEFVSKLWLDGTDEPPYITKTEGTYIWQPNVPIPYFKWELKGQGITARPITE